MSEKEAKRLYDDLLILTLARLTINRPLASHWLASQSRRLARGRTGYSYRTDARCPPTLQEGKPSRLPSGPK